MSGTEAITEAHRERAAVDGSLRGPVLFLLGLAVLWLLVSTALGAVAALKLVWPDFLSGCAMATYGRVWPAYTSTLVYGWALPAGFAVGLWILARLARVELVRSGWLVIGGALWNLGVAAGLAMILAGWGTGYELLEYPTSARLILLLAWLVMGSWAFAVFKRRRPGHVFIAVWYLLGAVLWFPWLLGGATAMMPQMKGVMLPVVAAWYAGALLNLVLPAIGLGVAYYLIPKVTGRPIASYPLAQMAFWTFAAFAPWTGAARLVGAPLPVWIPAIGVAACILMLVPAFTATGNFAMTMKDNWGAVHHSPAIRFTFFGALAYLAWVALTALLSTRGVAVVSQFSTVSAGLLHMGVYCSFSMVIFGAIYYIVPRLVGCEWLSSGMIRLHFWGAAYGMGMAVFAMLVGGIAAGSAWATVDMDKSQAIIVAQPYLVGRALALLLVVPAHLVFAFHFLLMLPRLGRPAGGPTLLGHGEAEEAHA